MAVMHCDFFSQILGRACQMAVILPQAGLGLERPAGNWAGPVTPPRPRGFGGYPTLYLLHGQGDDHTAWLRYTSLERYVAPLGLAVVMPVAQRSFYSNMSLDSAYWDFLSGELPTLARQFFPLSPRRQDNFVAGVSMGGYGALKLALRQPERWAAAASLSGALDVGRMLRAAEERRVKFTLHGIFGSAQAFAGSEDDLLTLLRRPGAGGRSRKRDKGRRQGRGKIKLPALYLACGTKDFLYQDNQTFRAAAAAAGVELTYEEGPGDHDWGYWDRMIQAVLRWLPLAGKKPA